MTDPGGKQVAVPYGPRAMGIVCLTTDGRMMSALVDGRSTLPDGVRREYSSYCGNYTFDVRTPITAADANSDPARFSASQVRMVRFEGERMVLTPPEVEQGGIKLRREINWKRLSTVSLWSRRHALARRPSASLDWAA